MAKRVDERGNDKLTHGRTSSRVDAIMKKLKLDPMSEVNRMQFQKYSEEVIARVNAFTLDSYAREMISDHIKEGGFQVTNYESDLYDTQGKLAKQEMDLMFHRQVLDELKARYVSSNNDDEKADILQQIAMEEEIIFKSTKLYNEMINTRNKIRTCMDRKLKPKQSYNFTQNKEEVFDDKPKIDIDEIDFGDEEND